MNIRFFNKVINKIRIAGTMNNHDKILLQIHGNQVKDQT